ncbi:nucleotidyl transferase AbiEii/AbiGii toxin family protein [Legionella resiliens]|uniref:Nucleotidyl transferase AbiEii/AbiGii toxin family protein n=1 Tax=Legionella resiliens TaxID=2905958 RepID=A0ABS8WZ52_9GAMM|nr:MULTISPECIES: nucleotidyl transferase AbiEii/AbiGii toxin family protein [unclassified Legionella]MCE0722619.1 nucleotidyl transferase AbiEii/AbiGii toxin family protein [Legionella sp. 9fVS26]MCE3531773.1 nucleotidyl transferase AbiEii/AbiGii toxin family protein [Legionella sp. 8cVS16]
MKNIAVKEGSDFNAVLTRYGLERLLYRIGESEYSKQFLLKGALLFNLWYDMPHRPTKDIDLLGFGPIEAHYPVLLNDLPAPKIRTYPIYTVIAEKLHAIALLGMTNSRLKDYLDLYVLLSNEQIDNQVLAKAIQATFTRRGVTLPEVLPFGLTDEFANDPSRESMWKAFLRKNELEQKPLTEVIAVIRNLIQVPYSLAK